jgi:hypothetical protein
VRSRTLGEENPTKTKAARGIIRLKPHIAAILRSIKPVRVDDKAYVFLNKLGKPINANEFRKSQWHRCLRLLEIPYRDFYSTKDTAISLDLTAGENAKKVAQEARISMSTLEKNYGIYMEQGVQPEVQRETAKNEMPNKNTSLGKRPRRDSNPCCRRERPVSWARLDDGDGMVSRAGFEPATLCLKGRCSTA